MFRNPFGGKVWCEAGLEGMVAEGWRDIQQSKSLFGAQLTWVTKRIGRGAAKGARQIARLGNLPDHQERSVKGGEKPDRRGGAKLDHSWARAGF